MDKTARTSLAKLVFKRFYYHRTAFTHGCFRRCFTIKIECKIGTQALSYRQFYIQQISYKMIPFGNCITNKI